MKIRAKNRKRIICLLTLLARKLKIIGLFFQHISVVITKRWKYDNSVDKAQKIIDEKTCKIVEKQNKKIEKTIVNFGDSIFGCYSSPEDISTYIQKIMGVTAYNVGFGGCRMSNHSIKGYDAFSMHKLAHSISTGDWTQQEQALKNVPWGDGSKPSSHHIKNYETLKSIDFSKVDIITIAYGTNDWSAGIELYNENSYDVNTYIGALQYSIKSIKKAYPHIEIVICTPIYRFWIDDNGTFIDDSNTHNINGYRLIDFVQALKEMGKQNKMLVIDNYYESGISVDTRNRFFPSADGIHPNAAGRAMISLNIAKNLIEYFA